MFTRLQLTLLTLCAFFLLPFITHAATLSLSPANASVAPGNTVAVSIMVSTPDQPMNAASGVLTFPSDLLEAVSLSKAQSIVGLWVQEPAFSNAAGTINFEGVVLNPGFTGASGRLLTVNFRAKRAGNAAITYTSPTVLANDGEGTNILTAAAGANIQILGGLLPAPVGSDLVIVSSTHPNQDKWYQATTAKFAWKLPEGATAVRLLADSSRSSTPSLIYDPAISQKEVRDLPEGTSYFHAQARVGTNWSAPAHYRLQIDTTPPEYLNVSEIARLDPTESIVRLKFESSDALSGIDHYEIGTGDGREPWKLWSGTEGEIYETEELDPGTHTINVRAVDRAGNLIASSIVVTVQAPPGAWWVWGQKALSAFSLAIPLAALVILLGIMLERSHARFRAWRRKLHKEVDAAEKGIEHTFDLVCGDLEKHLDLLERTKNKRALTREESRIMTNLRKNLRLAERSIKKELEDIEKKVK